MMPNSLISPLKKGCYGLRFSTLKMNIMHFDA